MGKVVKMIPKAKDYSNHYPRTLFNEDLQKFNYSISFLENTDLYNKEQLVPNSIETDYTNDIVTRIFVKDLQTGDDIQLEEVGGETIMSEQLDRQKIQEMIEKELKSHERHFDLKLETMSTKLDAGLKDVESKLSQKIDSMNASLSQTLLEIKSENALIKKDIELQSVATQALVTKSFNDSKELINVEKEKLRIERKNDRKYLITTTVATCGIVLTLLVRLFI